MQVKLDAGLGRQARFGTHKLPTLARAPNASLSQARSPTFLITYAAGSAKSVTKTQTSTYAYIMLDPSHIPVLEPMKAAKCKRLHEALISMP